MMRGRRLQRIDRALSHVLDAIENVHNERRMECATWRALDILSAEMDALRIEAYDKAKRLETLWQQRVARSE
jgi:predicted component of type VI protein secretion system